MSLPPSLSGNAQDGVLDIKLLMKYLPRPRGDSEALRRPPPARIWVPPLTVRSTSPIERKVLGREPDSSPSALHVGGFPGKRQNMGGGGIILEAGSLGLLPFRDGPTASCPTVAWLPGHQHGRSAPVSPVAICDLESAKVRPSREGRAGEGRRARVEVTMGTAREQHAWPPFRCRQPYPACLAVSPSSFCSVSCRASCHHAGLPVIQNDRLPQGGGWTALTSSPLGF